MASVVAEKLYPPTIPSSIPAFYVENGTAKIAVPFSMNRAVDANSVAGFRLKIKTVQSNTLLKIIDIDTDAGTLSAINSRIATFEWVAEVNGNRTPDFNKVKIGQYLKLQIAYLGKNRLPGYFSTVGITKYTSKPLVSIANADVKDDPNAIPVFRQSYTGVYQTTEDTSERPYSYCFYLFNALKGLEETSGWKLHNTSVNRVATEAIALDQSIDTYTFTAPMQDDKLYYIQYGVRTINNLEVYSPLYPVFQALTDDTQLKAHLVAENNFDNAYIKLKLSLNEGITTETVWPVSGSNSYISIQIERAAKTSNYQEWQILKKVAFLNYTEVVRWSFKDFTVEQGVSYLYRFRQYSENGICSKGSEIDEPIMADFEDMFLWDGQKQLKIRFNPKVSSFKATLMEQKIETIGSKYPFIFKNGIVNYKEFPIAGLISHVADENMLFLDKESDLGLTIVEEPIRRESPGGFTGFESQYIPVLGDYDPNEIYYYRTTNDDGTPTLINGHYEYTQSIPNDTNRGIIQDMWEDWSDRLFTLESVSTIEPVNNLPSQLDLSAETMRAERIFKLKVLEWLNNGEVKLFKSPAEGNYFVRLMNVSLTPEDKLGRMLHSMQATAYEMEELTYSNLLDMNFISVDDYEVSRVVTMSRHAIKDIINNAPFDNQETSIPINIYLIVNQLNIAPPPGVSFYVRIGENTPDNKVLIANNFTLAADNTSLPSIWFNPDDNKELIQLLSDHNGSDQPTKENCISLVGDTTFTYDYYATSAAVGNFYGITSITVKNKVETWNGPRVDDNALSFGAVAVTNEGLNTEPVIMKFWALEFTKKVCETKLIRKNNKYYLYDNQTVQVSIFDTSQLYEVMESPYETNSNVKIYYSEDGTSLIAGTNNYHVGFYPSNERAEFYNQVDQHVTLSYSRDLTLEEQVAKDAALAAIDEAIREINQNSELSASEKASLIAQKNIEMNTILNQYGPYSTRFKTPPIINLYEAINYNKIEFGWGVTLKTAYQERTVKYH